MPLHLRSLIACALAYLAIGEATAQVCPPSTRIDREANIDQRMPPDTCSARGYTRAQCTAAGGIHFKPDDGSGFTECFFRPQQAGRGSYNRNPGIDYRARHIEQAKAFWREGQELFRLRRYQEASSKFISAAGSYDAGGDSRSADLAQKEAHRCDCYHYATVNWGDADKLGITRDLHCGDFAEILKRIAQRIEELNAAARQPKHDDAKRVVVLVATPSGLFYGTAEGRLGAGTATTEAEATCNALKANTGTTPEERNEPCNRSIFTAEGCVALARSHDMYWGAPSTRVARLAAAKPAEAARERALAECKRAGGQNCFVVPESVRCVGGGFGSHLRSQ